MTNTQLHFPHKNRNLELTPQSGFEKNFMHLADRALTLVMKSQTKLVLTSHNNDKLTLPPPIQGHEYTLYMHIPFCESLCPYCSFNRFLYESQKASQYFSALREEMKRVAELGYDFKTLYIGGGTPTINLEELTTTIDLARELFSIQEVSCETNPNHLIPQYIDQLKDRVQRLSVGVQSFDALLLEQMNRLEKFGSGEEILDRIRYAAPFFKSLNVDMIFNFPSQTREVLMSDIEKVISSSAQQVTFYPLMSSSVVEQSMSRSVGTPTRQREWEYFNLINNSLKADFEPLSAWTFVRQSADMIDEYIVDSEEYVGIGSGAFSYLNGELYINYFSINKYLEAINQGRLALSGGKRYNKHAQMRYWFMMNLFGMDFNRQAFKKRFTVPVWIGLGLEMLFMFLTGSFRRGDHRHLTRRGQYLSLVLMREFFSGVNNLRDIARKHLSPLELASASPVHYVGAHSTSNGFLRK